MDEDERQQEREHPLEDHEPSLPGQERRVWPCDLDQAGVDARPERCGQLSKILRREHRGRGISQEVPPCEREIRPPTSAVSVLILVCERTGLLLEGQQGPELLPEKTEGGLDRSLGFGHRGGDVLKRLILQQSRLPGVPPLLFSQPHFSQVPEGPHLFRHECADPCKGIARALDLRFELRQSALPQASCGLQRQELPGILVHAGADVPELLLHPRESTPSAMALSRLARRPDTAVARG